MIVTHSHWSRACNGRDIVPHHAICATRTAFPYKELFARGRRRALPFHIWRGVVLKEIIEQFYALILRFDQIYLDFVSVKLSRTRPRWEITSWKPLHHTLIPLFQCHRPIVWWITITNVLIFRCWIHKLGLV